MRTEATGSKRNTPRRDQLIRHDDLADRVGLSARQVRTHARRAGWVRWMLEGRLHYEKREVRGFIDARGRARRAS